MDGTPATAAATHTSPTTSAQVDAIGDDAGDRLEKEVMVLRQALHYFAPQFSRPVMPLLSALSRQGVSSQFTCDVLGVDLAGGRRARSEPRDS